MFAVLGTGHGTTYALVDKVGDCTHGGEKRIIALRRTKAHWIGTGFAAKGFPNHLFSSGHNVEYTAPPENLNEQQGESLTDYEVGSGEEMVPKIRAVVPDKICVLPLEKYHDLPDDLKTSPEAFEESGGCRVYEYKTLLPPLHNIVASCLHRDIVRPAADYNGLIGIDLALLKLDKKVKSKKHMRPYPLSPNKGVSVSPHEGKEFLALGCPNWLAGYVTLGPPPGIVRTELRFSGQHIVGELVQPCVASLHGLSGGPILVPSEGAGAAHFKLVARRSSVHIKFGKVR